MWEKNNAVQRTAAEAAAKVRFKAEAKRAKREREKAEEMDNDVAEMEEMAEKMRKAREAKVESEDDTEERGGTWAEAKAMEKADIAKLADEASEKDEFKARVKNNANIVNREEVQAAS